MGSVSRTDTDRIRRALLANHRRVGRNRASARSRSPRLRPVAIASSAPVAAKVGAEPSEAMAPASSRWPLQRQPVDRVRAQGEQVGQVADRGKAVWPTSSTGTEPRNRDRSSSTYCGKRDRLATISTERRSSRRR